MSRIPQDLARSMLIDVADALERDAGKPDRIESTRKLAFAVEVLRAVAAGQDARALYDGRKQDYPRWQAVWAVVDVASSVPTLAEAFREVAAMLGCDESTIRRHWNAHWRERGTDPLLEFGESVKART